MHTATRNSGYSFIEMLTALAVLSILLAVAVLTMGPAVRHGRVRNAANVVAGDIQYARVLAAQHRRPMSLIVVPATRQYIIRERDDATVVYRTRSLGDDSEFDLDSLTSSPASSVELYPNGAARQTTTLTLAIADFQRQVRLSRAGQIRILQ